MKLVAGIGFDFHIEIPFSDPGDPFGDLINGFCHHTDHPESDNKGDDDEGSEQEDQKIVLLPFLG